MTIYYAKMQRVKLTNSGQLLMAKDNVGGLGVDKKIEIGVKGVIELMLFLSPIIIFILLWVFFINLIIFVS